MSDQTVETIKAFLLDINEFVLQLDPSIRGAAFEILTSGKFSKVSSTQKNHEVKNELKHSENRFDLGDTDDLGEFISKFDNTTPAQNVELLVAWLYRCYGVYPITVKEIKELADSCGLIVPNRSDNTMRGSKKNNKNLFSQQGSGWKLTVTGEMHLKESYGVRKGSKSLPKD